MNHKASLSAILVWLMLALPGWAQSMVEGNDPRVILEVARNYGSAALETLSNGDPNIIGRIDGIGYAVHFVNCTNNTDCQSLNFYTAFANVKPSLERINEWNSAKRYGRAYLDVDQDAAIEMDVNLAYGVARANLDANFSIWRLVITQYMAHIGLSVPGQ